MAASFGSRHREALSLLALFGLSRLGYYLLGVRFQLRPLNWYWQVIDPRLLADRPVESLLHLHSQPPLWNAYLAFVLQFPEPFRAPIFTGSFLLAGLAVAWGLYALLAELGIPLPVRAAVTALFAVSPAVVLYENQLSYDYPVLAALIWSALLLLRFLARGGTAALAGGCALLSALVLTRSLFHLAFLLLVVAGLAALAGPARGRVLRWGGGAILVSGAWYLHIWLLFGSFSASTWFGMSVAKMVVRTATAAERAALADASSETRILGHMPFRPLADYSAIVPLPAPTGIPLLDRLEKRPGLVNYHHLGYIEVAERFRIAATWTILHRPGLYLRGLGTAWRLYFRSPADEKLLEPNASIIEPVERWYRLACGQLRRMAERDQVGPGEFAWLLLAAWLGGIVCGVRFLVREGLRSPRGATVAFMLATTLYVATAGNSLDLGENNRFGFLVLPFVLCLLALATARGAADQVRKR